MEKDADAYRTISEVAEALDVPAHVLRFWEAKFAQIKPLKRGGGRRYYRRTDVDLLRTIRRLLYEDAYTIRGVQRLLKQRGAVAVTALTSESLPPLQPEDLEAVRAEWTPLGPIRQPTTMGSESPSGSERTRRTLAPADAPGLAGPDQRSAASLAMALASEIAACRDILAATFAMRPGISPDA